ncbi:hypothetical protein ZYGNAAKF_CDS0042 [Enterococcus phage VRE9_2]
MLFFELNHIYLLPIFLFLKPTPPIHTNLRSDRYET